MYAKKNSGLKVTATLLAIVLLIGCAVGGTIAWLMDTTDEVKNTFSVGNINIDLSETVDEDGFKILPGTEETKGPIVTVQANSEDCWVFVQVQEVNNDADDSHKYVTWNIDENYWTLLSQVNGINTYYAKNKYETIGSDVVYNVLAGQKVSYGDSLTKVMIDKLYTGDAIDTSKQPQLNFKAFAVQAEAGETAPDAWANVPSSQYLGATT